METRNKILGSAIELFSQYGFKNVTMDDIARRAGISKKTLYQHFTNKPDIVEEAVVWHQSDNCHSCEVAMEDSANAIEAMVRVMMLLDKMYRQINPVAMFELQRFYPSAYDKFRKSLLDQDVKAVRSNIERGISEGLYREGIDVDLLSRFHIEAALMVLQPNLLVNDRYTLQQVNHVISEHFLYGLMTPKGEKLYLKYKDSYSQQPSKA
jgi:AcrR family transcriptional regulator